jgi:putative holliday junction resolvase
LSYGYAHESAALESAVLLDASIGQRACAMPLKSLEDLLAHAGRGSLAGLDLGTKTIGVAVSDLGWTLANPRAVVRRVKFTADVVALLDQFQRDGVVAAIIGYPLNMDGSEGPRAQSTRSFVRSFERLSPLEFVLWDERLSTVAAERALLERDMSRAKRAERIDSAAASFILQGALDRLQGLRRLQSS